MDRDQALVRGRRDHLIARPPQVGQHPQPVVRRERRVGGRLGRLAVRQAVGGWLLGMRNTMINVLSEDYITMAQARGLPDRRVMLGYAARNAVLPQITGFALSLGYLVGGQILIESVFSYPGVGLLMAQSIGVQDYPVIQALLLVITVCVLLANLAADLVYARLDPRARAA